MQIIMLLGLALFALSGCVAPFTLQPQGQATIGDELRVETPIAWSRRSVGKIDVWTVDGYSLQELRFAVGISDGQTLFSTAERDTGSEDGPPKFRGSTTNPEIRDFVVASFAALNITNMTITNVRPARLGEVPGVRMDYEFVNRPGLVYRGFAVGAVQKSRLYLIMFHAPATHYFDLYKDHAEKITASADLKS